MKQYQVTVDPDKLVAHKVPINRVVERIRRSNQEEVRPSSRASRDEVRGM